MYSFLTQSEVEICDTMLNCIHAHHLSTNLNGKAKRCHNHEFHQASNHNHWRTVQELTQEALNSLADKEVERRKEGRKKKKIKEIGIFNRLWSNSLEQ